MSIITKKSAQKFWDQCCEYLNDKTDIELVRKEANIENKTILITMDEFYEHLLKSLKNRQFMPNAIGILMHSNLFCLIFRQKVSMSIMGLGGINFLRTLIRR